MHVEGVRGFAFANGVGDLAFDDGPIVLSGHAADGQMGGIVAVSHLVVDVPLVDHVRRVGIGVARELDRLELADAILLECHRHFGCVFDFHVDSCAARVPLGRVLRLASYVLVVVLLLGREFQD